MWRKFEPRFERVAAACARDLWSDEPFTPTGRIGGGGSTAVQVQMNTSKLLAWAKPARVGADSGVQAAYEKIAADMAFALGLPVAAVVLSRQTAGLTLPPGLALPPIVALSFEMLEQGRQWGDLMPLLAAEQKAEIKKVATAMRVFHALIYDGDHGGIGANSMFERSTDGTMRACYYDHSNSVTRNGWQPPAAPPIAGWGTWAGDFADPDRGVVDAILQRIEWFPSEELGSIMSDECLPPPPRAALFDGLKDRCGKLRGILNP